MVLTCFSICTKMVRCMCPLNTSWSLSTVSLRYFVVGAPWQKASPPKSNREALIKLNRENLRLYGPLLKSRKKLMTKESALLDPDTPDLDSGSTKLKEKLPIKSDKNSKIIIKKSQTSAETVKKSKTTSKKSKKSTSKSPDFSPDDSPAVMLVEQKTSESNADLVLPENWKETISSFISKQTLTVSDMDLLNDNTDYKNILNMFNVRSLPSVTTILNKTLSPVSRLMLQQWKARMTREMGPANFQKYQEGNFICFIFLMKHCQSLLLLLTCIFIFSIFYAFLILIV